ncbi:MAG: acyltransferase [Bacteroides sp.]|nr:acyltransferase [Bacteroides sp.]MCM1413000.1 acyltransferase [Bacteroides sp.]MCM1471706.1 acyltransferase [Bacteroides sp.]
MRQSNIEILRIISMLMILIVHFDGASLGLPILSGHISAMTARDAWQLSIESLAIVGVNCFTLISGYFGIRLRLRTVVAFLFQCIFYATLTFVAFNLIYGFPISIPALLTQCLVITHTDLWYVPAYFGLMLIAPILNAGFDHMTSRQALTATGAFILFNIWAGWWWGAGFNPTGYTIVQLIMIYCLGRCIALHLMPLLAGRHRQAMITAAAVYFGATLLTTIYAVSDTVRAYAYNSPLVIIASAALLVLFASFSCSSPTVKLVARSSFAVYLIHKAPIVWGNYLRPTVDALWHHTTLTQFTLYSAAAIIAIYLLAMIIDPARRALSRLLFSRLP